MAIHPAQDLETLLRVGLTTDLASKAAWAIEPTGVRHRGAAAIFHALDWALRWKLFRRLYGLPPIASIAEAAYTRIARWRHHLPGVKPYCLQFPERCTVIPGAQSPPPA